MYKFIVNNGGYTHIGDEISNKTKDFKLKQAI